MSCYLAKHTLCAALFWFSLGSVVLSGCGGDCLLSEAHTLLMAEKRGSQNIGSTAIRVHSRIRAPVGPKCRLGHPQVSPTPGYSGPPPLYASSPQKIIGFEFLVLFRIQQNVCRSTKFQTQPNYIVHGHVDVFLGPRCLLNVFVTSRVQFASALGQYCQQIVPLSTTRCSRKHRYSHRLTLPFEIQPQQSKVVC